MRLDWSADSKYIQLETDRNELLVWEIDSESSSQYLRTEDHSEILWATKTCVLGWHTQGYLQCASSLSRLCGDRSNRMDVLVTGVDGKVALFRNPCAEKTAQPKVYHGHFGAVAAIRFTFDDKHVVSAGLADNCIIIWQHIIIPQVEYDSEVDLMIHLASAAELKAVDQDVEVLSASKPYLSAVIPPSTMNSRQSDAPAQNLKLEYIFGCNQSYRQLDILNTGEVLYPAGAIAVLLNPSSGQQRFYSEHSGDILTMCLHPSKEVVLTVQGQEEALIHVWNSKTLKSLCKLSCPYQVKRVCFTVDGDKVVIIAQGKVNTIALYDWNTKTKLASEDYGCQAVLDIGCHPDGAMIVTCGSDDANGQGCVTFWSLKRGSWQRKHGFLGTIARSSTMLCVEFTKDITKFTLTGSQHGCIYVWKMHILCRASLLIRKVLASLRISRVRPFACMLNYWLVNSIILLGILPKR